MRFAIINRRHLNGVGLVVLHLSTVCEVWGTMNPTTDSLGWLWPVLWNTGFGMGCTVHSAHLLLQCLLCWTVKWTCLFISMTEWIDRKTTYKQIKWNKKRRYIWNSYQNHFKIHFAKKHTTNIFRFCQQKLCKNYTFWDLQNPVVKLMLIILIAKTPL